MEQAIPPTRDLPLQLLARLGRAVAAQQAATGFHAEARAQFLGLSPQEQRCLEVVERLGPVTSTQLVAACGLSHGAVTALLDRLEAMAYVRRQRQGEDRRDFSVDLTSSARDLLSRLDAQAGEMSASALDGLSAGEIEAVTRFLESQAWIGQVRARLLVEHLPPGQRPVAADRFAAAERFAEAAVPSARTVMVGIATGAIPTGIPEPAAAPVTPGEDASAHSAA